MAFQLQNSLIPLTLQLHWVPCSFSLYALATVAPSIPWTYLALSCHKALAHAVPSAWKALLHLPTTSHPSDLSPILYPQGQCPDLPAQSSVSPSCSTFSLSFRVLSTLVILFNSELLHSLSGWTKRISVSFFPTSSEPVAPGPQWALSVCPMNDQMNSVTYFFKKAFLLNVFTDTFIKAKGLFENSANKYIIINPYSH